MRCWRPGSPVRYAAFFMRERFPETSWTLLAKAREQCDEGVRARENFAEKYYRPVLDFLLVLVQDAEESQDLAQEFFARLSGPGGLIEHVDRAKGSFRAYLQQALRNLVIDHHRRSHKDALLKHPDQEQSAGGWEVIEFPGFPAAEAAFHNAWLKITLAEALTQVRAICLSRNQNVHLGLFEARYLGETDAPPGWDELGARYGLDQKAARERAETVARHFRLVLRRLLRNELTGQDSETPRARVAHSAIDDEIRALLSPIAG